MLLLVSIDEGRGSWVGSAGAWRRSEEAIPPQSSLQPHQYRRRAEPSHTARNRRHPLCPDITQRESYCTDATSSETAKVGRYRDNTNNQAERDLRMAKLQMKISGCWRTDTGAATFAALRSYVSTVRKHRASVIDAITALVEGNPWLPAHA